MGERERLIELLSIAVGDCNLTDSEIKIVADYLRANGVIALPCKIGDSYYTIQKYYNTDPLETEKEPVAPWDCEKYCERDDCSFSEWRIEEHKIYSTQFILQYQEYFGKTYFLTKSAAEEALKREIEKENKL